MPYTWVTFTAYLDGSRKILTAERDELWDALAWLLAQCGGRWRLKAADISAMKNARLEGDLTTVEDPDDTATTESGDLAKVLIAIEDTFTGTTGYDAFKAVRAAEGIDSDAKLAELIGTGGRVTRADNWHVWNLYKRVLSALTCCPTAEPEAEDDSIPASQARWGLRTVDDPEWYGRADFGGNVHQEWKGADCASPNHVYAKKTLTLSGALVSEPAGVTSTVEAHQFSESRDSGDPGSTFATDLDSTLTGLNTNVASLVNAACTNTSGFTLSFQGGLGTAFIVTNATASESVSGEGACRNSFSANSNYTTTGTVTESFSEPVTAAVVIAYVQSVIAGIGFDGDWNDTAGSYRNQSAPGGDGSFTYYERLSKRRWNISAVEGFIVGRSYRLHYVTRFTPLSGASVDGDTGYVEFVYTEGMTETEGVDVPLPEENGTNHLVWTGWECVEG